MHSPWVGIVLAMVVAPQAHALVCERTSPAHTVALVELYTSQGCDSCPPADRWLGTLAGSRLVDERVVPLGLHVNYWDHLGWKDPYAKALFTDRQRAISRASGVSYVYTPQVVVQGRDFRGWGSAAFATRLDAINRTPARAEIRLSMEVAGDALRLAAQAKASARSQLFAALAQDRISNKVTAGENRGATLAHNASVREWYGPIPLDAQGRANWQTSAALPAGARLTDMRLVGFVQDSASGEILQAIGLPGCVKP
ncbi:MAG: DUF1223 domain-containing protein [Burkholderiales bacterium]|nr:DUF1223 domain-containing protein [Burkholderiales bacterium]